jgi:hypothetical protein
MSSGPRPIGVRDSGLARRSCAGVGTSAGCDKSANSMAVGNSVGMSVGMSWAQCGPMAHPSFDLFRDQWTSCSHSNASARALSALSECEASVSALGCRDLGDLVEFIGGVGRWVDPVTADRLVGAMVANQDSDPMIGVAVVVTLTPGLKALARRMDWGSGGPWGGAEVFSGELMSTAWEVVADWSGRRHEFMVPAILTAIRKRLVRRIQACRREADRRTEWSMVAEPEGCSESVIEELARVLENAADLMISRGDASLVYAHRVLGLSMVELAEMTGQSRNTLHHRATYAERRLCA